MPETVLVTGADGFVGRAVVPRLVAGGFEVWSHTRAHGDLADAPPARASATVVVHLAGRTFVPESWAHPDRFYRDNTLATAHVLEYARRNHARIVYLSAYVYGIPQRLPITESHPVQAINPYAHSKILAEDLVRFYTRQFGVVTTIVRPFNLYGPGQDARFIIPSIVRQGLDPAVAAITVENLAPRRDYLYVDDLAGLVVAALRAPAGGTYNAGRGQSTSVETLVNLVRELVPTAKPVQVTGAERANEIPDTVADISRAAADLDWHPTMTLREGLGRTIGALRGKAASR